MRGTTGQMQNWRQKQQQLRIWRELRQQEMQMLKMLLLKMQQQRLLKRWQKTKRQKLQGQGLARRALLLPVLRMRLLLLLLAGPPCSPVGFREAGPADRLVEAAGGGHRPHHTRWRTQTSSSVR